MLSDRDRALATDDSLGSRVREIVWSGEPDGSLGSCFCGDKPELGLRWSGEPDGSLGSCFCGDKPELRLDKVRNVQRPALPSF